MAPRSATPRVGAGSGHGGSPSGGSQDKIGRVPTGSGREGIRKRGGRQGPEPEVRLATHLAVGQHIASAIPVGR